jgi:adenylate kinase
LRKYIVMGVLGSGKGTQAKLLADALDLEHISVGARLRDYHAKTKPVLDLFRAKEFVLAVDATHPVGDVQSETRTRLGVDRSRD